VTQSEVGDGADSVANLLSMLNNSGNEEGLEKLLEGMMGQLMSKEVLYEPMKELSSLVPFPFPFPFFSLFFLFNRRLSHHSTPSGSRNQRARCLMPSTTGVMRSMKSPRRLLRHTRRKRATLRKSWNSCNRFAPPSSCPAPFTMLKNVFHVIRCRSTVNHPRSS